MSAPKPIEATAKPLLPDSLKQPFVLFWVWIVPQAVLLALNLHAFYIAVGDISAEQRHMAYEVFGSEVFLFAVGCAVVLTLRALRKPVSWSVNWLLLALPVLHLWLFTYRLETLLPRSVVDWILPPETVLYNQFALIMPAVFYAAVRLACFDAPLRRGVDVCVCVIVAVGAPALWYLVFHVMLWFRMFDGGLAAVVIIGLVIGLTIAMMTAIIRLLVMGYVWLQQRGRWSLAALTFVVGIAGPLGGLWLNRYFPFPADFQSVGVYVMAVLNGALLLVPEFRREWPARLVWLAQCVMFAFTLYFFIVFLPFLPLAIPAVIAIGTGFLILTPTVLFLVHGQRLLDGFRREAADGRRVRAVLLAALAVLAMPAVYTGAAWMDRAVLHRAMGYVFSPDYRRADRFDGNLMALRHSMTRLADFKAGLRLPFMSDYYDWIVFDNLVLPDDRLNRLHRTFFGSDLPVVSANQIGLFNTRGPRRASAREVMRSAPPSAVSMEAVTHESVREGECVRTRVTLKLRNGGQGNSEFVGRIELPESVLVSGFWLHIGSERVPGRLFEKKTALWVYQMIRDASRRDPGLLVYTGADSVELRVFPFAAGEQRTVEIEFLHPAVVVPTVRIGDVALKLDDKTPASDAGMALAGAQEGKCVLAMAPTALERLPRAKRRPYIHLIVDCSSQSSAKPEMLKPAIRDMVTRYFPDATECVITAGNYEFRDITGGLMSLGDIERTTDRALGEKLPPMRGGFLQDRAIKRALLWHYDQFSRARDGDAWLERFPVIVVLRAGHGEPLSDDDLAMFARFAPDTMCYYSQGSGRSPCAFDFANKPLPTANLTAARHPVIVLRCGNAVAVCAPLANAPAALVQFAPTVANRDLTVLDSASGRFRPVGPVSVIAPDTRYSRGMSAWLLHYALIENPSFDNAGLSDIVRLSRDSGVLVGSTSYIVVENSAQWKTLELKEKQKLASSNALEIANVPEPATVWLLIAGVAWLGVRTTRRSLKWHPQSASGQP